MVQNAITILIQNNPQLELFVADIPSLTLLKVISWKDRLPNNTSKKDALDLAFILRHYLNVTNQEELANHPDLIEIDNFNFMIAGARVLGRIITKIISQETKASLLKF